MVNCITDPQSIKNCLWLGPQDANRNAELCRDETERVFEHCKQNFQSPFHAKKLSLLPSFRKNVGEQKIKMQSIHEFLHFF
jgi:hypothetical protein